MEDLIRTPKKSSQSAARVSALDMQGERRVHLVFVLAVIVACVTFFVSSPEALTKADQLGVIALVIVYASIGTLGYGYCNRSKWRLAMAVYFVVQISLIAAIAMVAKTERSFSSFSLVPLPLVAQAAIVFSRTGILSVSLAVTAIVALISFARFGNPAALTAVAYLSGLAFVVALTRVLVREAQSRAEVERLASQLRAANRQLEEYAEQAGELAKAQERSRLARDLHDSVTQTIFSMTLTAEAASILIERQPEKAAVQLAHLKELAQSAMAEMRSLVQHLRPDSDEGFVPAIQKYLALLKAREGISVDLRVDGEGELSPKQVEELFRIAQEALNNVSKHSGARSASLDLKLDDQRVSLAIKDQGVGFDRRDIPQGGKGGIGLNSMRERAEMLGGTLTIISSPSEGTCVQVEIPRTTPPLQIPLT